MDKNYSNEMEVKEVPDGDNIVAQLVNAIYRNSFRNFKIYLFDSFLNPPS